MLPEHSAQPREERQSGGLAFALNHVDILSLPWKVERTLETLGGSRKMRKRCRVGSRKGGGGVIFIQFIQSKLLLTPAVHWKDTAEFREGAGQAKQEGEQPVNQVS